MARLENPKDIVQMKFGKLTVVECVGKINDRWHYRCLCECGNEAIVGRSSLRSGNTKSCGQCYRIVKENDYYRYYCSKGGSFIFDAIDYDAVASKQWAMTPYGYVQSHHTMLCKMIMAPQRGEFVDHINGDRSDNRRSNLRLVSRVENNCNRRISRKNTSGFKGVSYNKEKGKYDAHIGMYGHRRFLGRYDTAEQAAYVYDAAAREIHGAYAAVNFPQKDERGCREVV